MNTAPIATSILAASEPTSQAWPLLPVETEIYILPDGRVVVADLPAELASLLTTLGLTALVENPVPVESSPAHE